MLVYCAGHKMMFSQRQEVVDASTGTPTKDSIDPLSTNKRSLIAATNHPTDHLNACSNAAG